jgi:L-alanine-DL-glutamate epimerase-like enolase superfamily enzyme
MVWSGFHPGGNHARRHNAGAKTGGDVVKITRIETIRPAAHGTLIWVLVHTDQGVVGLGESWFGCAATEADLHERLAPALIGQDPSRIEGLTRQMRPYTGFTGTSAELRALSAVDIALWDIAGKVAGQPVYALLGGATRDSIRVYNTCAGPQYTQKSSDVRPDNFGLAGEARARGKVYDDLRGFLDRPEELAAELLEMGIGAMKIWPFDFSEGAGHGGDILPEDLARGLEPFRRIRRAHGDRMRLKVELHGLWGLPAAKKICRALEEIGPDWVEDPIWMDRLADVAELGRSTRVPLAGGETLGGLGQLRELIEIGRIDTPIIDPSWGGGITFARKVAALAEAFGKPVAFHDCSGPVTLAVATHLCIACPNVVEQEITRAFYYGWYQDFVDRLPPLDNGFIRPPAGPGLGLALVDGIRTRPDVTVRVTGD